MRYLSLAEVTELHRLVIEAFGGAHGIRDLGALESALAQPRMSFGAEDAAPSPPQPGEDGEGRRWSPQVDGSWRAAE